MTLGGLALAVGILVDDATGEMKTSIATWRWQGNRPGNPGCGAQQIAVPAFVSTLCICIVFIPMFFLSGVAKFLFIPLAEAVSFAMLASYMWSRTIVPTLAMYLLSSEDEYHSEDHIGERWVFSGAISKALKRVLNDSRRISEALRVALHSPRLFALCFLAFCGFFPLAHQRSRPRFLSQS